MRRAALIYNPASGQQQHRRLARVQAAARALEESDVTATLIPTAAAGSAGRQAVEALAAGHDAVFACGGDGTVFDVLQGMVAHAPEVPLGVVPLGTGNVLAFDLGIPRDPTAAIRKQLTFTPRRIAAGQIEYQARDGNRESRYFTLGASVGPDALMLYRTHPALKKRIGIFEYFRQAALFLLAHPYEEFVVRVPGRPEEVLCSQLSTVRVTRIGNRLRYFTMDSALHRDDFHALWVATPNLIRQGIYFLSLWGQFKWKVRGIDGQLCTELRCEALPSQTYTHGLYAQADGEVLGGLPVAIRIVPQAFTLLMPPVPGR